MPAPNELIVELLMNEFADDSKTLREVWTTTAEAAGESSYAVRSARILYKYLASYSSLTIKAIKNS